MTRSDTLCTLLYSADRLLFGAKYTGNTTLEIAAMGSTRPVHQYNQIAVQNPVLNGGVEISDGVARLHNGVSVHPLISLHFELCWAGIAVL